MSKKFTVYHFNGTGGNADRNSDAFDVYYSVVSRPSLKLVSKVWAFGHYDKVAVINANNENEVYRKTNHVDSSWHLEGLAEGDEAFVEVAKSSHLGDVFVDEDGKVFIVDKYGFIETTFEKLNDKKEFFDEIGEEAVSKLVLTTA